MVQYHVKPTSTGPGFHCVRLRKLIKLISWSRKVYLTYKLILPVNRNLIAHYPLALKLENNDGSVLHC